MKNIAWNITAVIVGFIVGSCVNMSLIQIGPLVIPPPEGTDVTTPEGIKAAIASFSPRHFVFPFLAHALGTLVGAFVAAKIAASDGLEKALTIGCFFLLGGITIISMIGGPLWYNATDLLLAYIPMAYLGAVLAGATKPKTAKDAVAEDAAIEKATDDES